MKGPKLINVPRMQLLKALELAVLAVVACQPGVAANASSILAANWMASGGGAWGGKSTLELKYDYSGNGFTGTSSSLQDLRRGGFVDSYDIPLNASAHGYDGARAWEKEPSGTVTDQAGGDVIPLAITESYLNRHLWWTPNYDGANVADEGEKTADGRMYDVLRVAPIGGTPVEAWFDPKSHLLFRTIEPNGTQTMTTTYFDYAPVEGAMIAGKLVLDDGSGSAQTYQLISARYSNPLPLQVYRKPAEDLHDFSIAGGARETTIPFRLLNNKVYADVSVDGSKPMTFNFDTGGYDIIAPQAAKQLGITPLGSNPINGGGDDTVQSGQAKVKSLTVGGVTITDQPIFILPISPPGTEGVKVDGIIGYEFFARFVTRFDYGNRTVTFIDKKHFDRTSAGIPVPMRLFHQLIEVLGSYDGIPGRFAIDTGARDGLLLNKVWAATNGIPRPGTRAIEAQTGWGGGGPSRALVFRGGNLKLGHVTIAHPLTEASTNKHGALAVAEFPNDVGGGVLKRFVVTLDYDHNTLFLKPIPGVIPDLDTFDRSGMWINATRGGFKVISLTKGGPAEASGLAIGDLITAIDGQSVTESDLPKVRSDWRNRPPGTAVSLKVRRNLGETARTLTLRDQI